MPVMDMDFGTQAHLFCELSILAYFDLPGATMWGTQMGFTRITQTAIPNDLAVTIFSNDSDIIISFRGTQDFDNVEEDLAVELVADGDLQGKVHEGFLTSFNRIWEKLLPCIDARRHRVWVTGHSLGGALAAIAAVRAARREGANVDGLFTFGQPRVGSAAYTASLGIDSYRWVNHLDLVPALPPRFMGYSHFGKEFYIDRRGIVRERTTFNLFKRLIDRLYLTPTAIGDHNMLKYRAAILRTNQESIHG
jgi:hypothetical protein